MKKILVFVFLFLSCVTITGCSKNYEDLIKENLSEVVENYFCGIGEFCVSVSSGRREKEYIYNGEKTESTEFAVFTIYTQNVGDYIEVSITCNNISDKYIFELNKISGAYIFDLEKTINKDDIIEIEYKNKKVGLKCVSENFKINYVEALNIGIMCFKDEMEKLISNKKFSGECYLRILDNAEDRLQKQFWYFYVYAKNKTTYSCVIDCNSGEIIVKN